MKKTLLTFLFPFILYYSTAQTSFRIGFDEIVFPNVTTTLVATGSTTVFSADYDVVQPTANMVDCSSTNAPEYTIYEKGQDGIPDLNVRAEVITKDGLLWNQTEADYSTVSNGSWRSDYGINLGDSRPNDYAYVKYTFTFLGDFANNTPAEFFEMRHTSSNGSSEGYEFTLVSINNTLSATEEAEIANYSNTIYNDVSSVAIGSGAAYMNGQTMSEFITNTSDIDGTQGGQVRAGLWAIDDFNTTIEEGNEDPTQGNGGPDDNQILNAASDIGTTPNQNVVSVTYIFGLYDVAFDLDNDGFTGTNTNPDAGLDYFEIGYPDDVNACPLPVELMSFKAAPKENEVELEWVTASETNNDYFQVERSYDGKQFESLRKVKGAGTTLVPKYYSYLDEQPKAGTIYYRLKQVDVADQLTKAKYAYSTIITVNVLGSGRIGIYPSPTDDLLTIKTAIPIQQITLFDLTGRQLAVYSIADNLSQLDVSALTTGVYVLKIQTLNGFEILRFKKL